jgi:hypothetical protein
MPRGRPAVTALRRRNGRIRPRAAGRRRTDRRRRRSDRTGRRMVDRRPSAIRFRRSSVRWAMSSKVMPRLSLARRRRASRSSRERRPPVHPRSATTTSPRSCAAPRQLPTRIRIAISTMRSRTSKMRRDSSAGSPAIPLPFLIPARRRSVRVRRAVVRRPIGRRRRPNGQIARRKEGRRRNAVRAQPKPWGRTWPTPWSRSWRTTTNDRAHVGGERKTGDRVDRVAYEVGAQVELTRAGARLACGSSSSLPERPRCTTGQTSSVGGMRTPQLGIH